MVATGDKNTRFFHTSTLIRRRRNRIVTLKKMLKQLGGWSCSPKRNGYCLLSKAVYAWWQLISLLISKISLYQCWRKIRKTVSLRQLVMRRYGMRWELWDLWKPQVQRAFKRSFSKSSERVWVSQNLIFRHFLLRMTRFLKPATRHWWLLKHFLLFKGAKSWKPQEL